MLSFNPYNILGGLVFGTLGWGAFRYGKSLELWQPRVIGLALMFYPYFCPNPYALWIVGAGLLVTLYFFHSE